MKFFFVFFWGGVSLIAVFDATIFSMLRGRRGLKLKVSYPLCGCVLLLLLLLLFGSPDTDGGSDQKFLRNKRLLYYTVQCTIRLSKVCPRKKKLNFFFCSAFAQVTCFSHRLSSKHKTRKAKKWGRKGGTDDNWLNTNAFNLL